MSLSPSQDQRLFFSATARNTEPIGKVLSNYLPKFGSVLEVASGSGEHAIAFQALFPELIWQASDPDLAHRRSISSWIKYAGLPNLMPEPLNLHVERDPWPLNSGLLSSLSAIVCINLIHVSPWNTSESLFLQAAELLPNNSPFILYGPFKINGEHTSQSNMLFDESLRAYNSTWGVKDLEDIRKLAIKNGFLISNLIEMPANNLSLILHRK